MLSLGCQVLGWLGGRRIFQTVRVQLGSLGFLWLAFVSGQGILAMVWLTASLLGILYASLVWMICIYAWVMLFVSVLTDQRWSMPSLTTVRLHLQCAFDNSWYRLISVGVLVIGLLHGLIALLPPSVDDAIKLYLVWSKIIAATHRLELQPFLHPFYALLPLQVEMHWAALFVIANESAVTIWDYFCAVSFLAGIGLLAWSLSTNRRIALFAMLIMLSTPSFYSMMGGGKVDNAGSQYGLAAFLWVLLWPALGTRAGFLAGLFLGWTVASRYTNIIMLPGLLVFGIGLFFRDFRARTSGQAQARNKLDFLRNIAVCGIGAFLAGSPMLIKNWFMVGCPLAPWLGCDAALWSGIYRSHTAHLQNISWLDLAFYPFVWTFASRDSMLGNISPLFLGAAPFLFVFRKSKAVKATTIAGIAGLASIGAWLLIEPFVLFTRFLLIPLSLSSLPLSAALVSAERKSRPIAMRWMIRCGITLMLGFLLFESRALVYAGRYVSSVDSRASRYRGAAGYELAEWLNTHVQEGERVSFSNFNGHRYFIEPRLLLTSESSDELQWLWENGRWYYAGSGRIAPKLWREEFWRFYASRGFTYVIIAEERVADAITVWPRDLKGFHLQLAAADGSNQVFRLQRTANP